MWYHKIVKSLGESGWLTTQKVLNKNKAKEQKGTFLGMLLGTLAASMLGNMLAGKAKVLGQGVIRAAEGVIWAGEGTIRAGFEL